MDGRPNRDHPPASGPEPLPPRPAPDQSLAVRLRAWGAWIGPTRLIVTAICTAVVVAGAYWLVRAPDPPVESGLPAAAGSAPGSTLPVPTTLRRDPSPRAGVAQTDLDDETARETVVHVAGRVRSPGVYRFEGPPRVHEAIERAGGVTPDADLDALNLAQPLVDGQRVYVPSEAEAELGGIETISPAASSTQGSADGAVDGGPVDRAKVDLNRATVVELETLPGVGPAIARAIVDDRDRHGPFATVDELDRVPGVGPAKLEALRDLVAV